MTYQGGGISGGVEATAKLFGGSEVFRRTYREGMGLVEEAAAYLDGPGREQAKDLPRMAALAYAAESMRVTTRLMQVAAWLLVQKAVHEGEMTPDEAAQEKYRLSGQPVARAKPLQGADMLPADLLALMEKSVRIYDRIERLDRQLHEEPVASDAPKPEETASGSPLASQFAQVEAFFQETLEKDRPNHERH